MRKKRVCLLMLLFVIGAPVTKAVDLSQYRPKQEKNIFKEERYLLDEDLIKVEFKIKNTKYRKPQLVRITDYRQNFRQDFSLSSENSLNDYMTWRNDLNIGTYRDLNYANDYDVEEHVYWTQEWKSSLQWKPLRPLYVDVYQKWDHRFQQEQQAWNQIISHGAKLQIQPIKGTSIQAIAYTERHNQVEHRLQEKEGYSLWFNQNLWKDKVIIRLGPQLSYQSQNYGSVTSQDRVAWETSLDLNTIKNHRFRLGSSIEDKRFEDDERADHTNRLFGEWGYRYQPISDWKMALDWKTRANYSVTTFDRDLVEKSDVQEGLRLEGEWAYHIEPEIDLNVVMAWKTRAEFSVVTHDKAYVKNSSVSQKVGLDFGPSLQIGEYASTELLFRYRATKQDDLGWVSKDEMIGLFFNSVF